MTDHPAKLPTMNGQPVTATEHQLMFLLEPCGAPCSVFDVRYQLAADHDAPSHAAWTSTDISQLVERHNLLHLPDLDHLDGEEH